MIKLTKQIGIIERCILLYRNKIQNDFGISGCHYVYFFVLNRRSGITQDELAKDLHINKSNVTRSIKTLKDLGYVDVVNDCNDKRINRLYLTSKGKNVFPVIKDVTNKCNDSLLANFSEDEINMLESLIEKLVTNAERMCQNENI